MHWHKSSIQNQTPVFKETLTLKFPPVKAKSARTMGPLQMHEYTTGITDHKGNCKILHAMHDMRCIIGYFYEDISIVNNYECRSQLSLTGQVQCYVCDVKVLCLFKGTSWLSGQKQWSIMGQFYGEWTISSNLYCQLHAVFMWHVWLTFVHLMSSSGSDIKIW